MTCTHACASSPAMSSDACTMSVGVPVTTHATPADVPVPRDPSSPALTRAAASRNSGLLHTPDSRASRAQLSQSTFDAAPEGGPPFCWRCCSYTQFANHTVNSLCDCLPDVNIESTPLAPNDALYSCWASVDPSDAASCSATVASGSWYLGASGRCSNTLVMLSATRLCSGICSSLSSFVTSRYCS